MLFFYAAALGLALAALRVLLERPPDRVPVVSKPHAGVRWWPVGVAAVSLQVSLVWSGGPQLPAPWRVATLWATHLALATVVVANLRHPGMRWLLAGMGLNFLVMAANGGLMPVSPETLVRGGREAVLARAAAGEPLPKKDVVLREGETRLALLSDRLVVPGHRGAFSIGDVLIAAGIVLALAAAGGDARPRRAGGAGGTAGTLAAGTVARPGAARLWGKPMVT